MNQQFMRRALDLSKIGIGHTNPNPLVGAVLVKDEKSIGEGYHEYYGGPHAEINAINSSTQDVRGATMYVTLEPCSHYGKTPPCVNTIIDRGISKVVIGMKDPNPIVAGRGIQILQDNGIEVITGVLEDEIKKLNEIFIKFITTKTPFCILKTAMTIDGKIATTTGDSKWIANSKSRKYVHQIRNRVSAIMVGIGTVIADDPLLTTRLEDNEGVDAVRIIVDTKGRIPLEAKVLNNNSNTKTILATTQKAEKDKLNAIEDKGAEILITPLRENRVDLKYLVKELGKRGVDSILIEGGSSLNYSALSEGIVDKVITFIAPKIVGGQKAKTPVGGEGIRFVKDCIRLDNISINRFDEDIMIEGYIRKGELD